MALLHAQPHVQAGRKMSLVLEMSLAPRPLSVHAKQRFILRDSVRDPFTSAALPLPFQLVQAWQCAAMRECQVPCLFPGVRETADGKVKCGQSGSGHMMI